jgi:hypothetical protein
MKLVKLSHHIYSYLKTLDQTKLPPCPSSPLLEERGKLWLDTKPLKVKKVERKVIPIISSASLSLSLVLSPDPKKSHKKHREGKLRLSSPKEAVDYPSIFHKLMYENHFLSPEIQHFVETRAWKWTTYTGTFGTLNVFYLGQPPELTGIFRILAFFFSLWKAPASLQLGLCFSPAQKGFGKFSSLSYNELSSGVTILSATGKRNIFVWREEEMEKVLCHELLHFFEKEKDCGEIPLKKYFSTTFKLTGTLLPQEGCAEAWATVYLTLFTALQLKVSFTSLFQLELLWTLVQTKKILAFHDLSPASFRAQVASEGQPLKILTADFFSYFFGKLGLLWNLSLFLEGRTEEAMKATFSDPLLWEVWETLPLPETGPLLQTLRFSAFQLARDKWV